MEKLVELLKQECADCWMDSETRTRNAIKEFFEKNNRVALAFNGDIASCVLLAAAISSSCVVKPYYMAAPLSDIDSIVKKAEKLGAQLSVVSVSGSGAEKRYLAAISAAKADGFEMIIDGRCASPNAETTPNHSAAIKLGIVSPLFLARTWEPELYAIAKQLKISDIII